MHEYKLLSSSGVNAPGLPGKWFWRMGLVARMFNCLEGSQKDSSLERLPMWPRYQKKKKRNVMTQ